MNQTEDIKELAAALSKAQGQFQPAKFNKINPHYKRPYADFTSVMEACRIPLSENGLSVLQYCETINNQLNLVTMIAHVSGQWIKSYLPLMFKGDKCQELGASMTYMKRYGLSAMLGIVADDDDDDGEADAAKSKNSHEPRVSHQEAVNKMPAKISAKQLQDLKKLDDKMDKDWKDKLRNWVNTTYGANSFDDLTVDIYPKVYQRWENGVKFLEQEAQAKADKVAI